MNNMRHLLLAASAIVLAASCQLRPLEDPSELVQIKVTVDTDHISNVTCDFYNPYITYQGITTDMIRCMFYNPSDGKLLSQSFIQEKTINDKGQEVLSGTVKILSGNFDIITYNFDTPDTLVRDESSEDSMTAYTSDVNTAIKSRFSVLAAKGGDERVINTPDHLVVSRDPSYHIAPHSELTVIETTARTCIDTYYLQIRVKNPAKAASISAVLTGLSPENAFAKDIRATDDPADIFFDLQVSKDDKRYADTPDDQAVICAVFNTFGKIAQAVSDLHVTAVTTSGKTVEKTFAMDKIFATSDAQNHHWLIIDEYFEIPDDPDPVSGGGFTPEVDDWEEEHGEIEL